MKKLKPTTCNPKPNAGFTIIELLVSMTIFAVVISITSVSFIGAIRAQRAIEKLIEQTGNASIAIERMAREIRTGVGFSLINDNRLRFINARGEAIHYYLNQSEQRIYEHFELTNTDVALTSRGVTVTRLEFIHSDSNANGDRAVDKVTLILTIGLPEGTQNISEVETKVQTTISVRPLNAPPSDEDENAEEA